MVSAALLIAKIQSMKSQYVDSGMDYAMVDGVCTSLGLERLKNGSDNWW